MASDFSVYWEYGAGPTSVQLLPRTSGTYGIRQAVYPVNLGAVAPSRALVPVPFGSGVVEQGYWFDKSRQVQLLLKVIAGTERRAWSEWEDLQSHFRVDRLGKLRIKYYEADGPTQRDRYLECRRVHVPTMDWPGSTGFVGHYEGGQITFGLVLEASYPHWRDYSETTTDTCDILTGGGDTITINNPGHFPIGFKFTLSSLVGNWTQISIANTTSGDFQGEGAVSAGTITWSHGTAFANSDYVDWRHTDPHLVTMNDGNVSATSNGVLWPGDNSITVIGTGGTSGTGTFAKRGAYS